MRKVLNKIAESVLLLNNFACRVNIDSAEIITIGIISVLGANMSTSTKKKEDKKVIKCPNIIAAQAQKLKYNKN